MAERIPEELYEAMKAEAGKYYDLYADFNDTMELVPDGWAKWDGKWVRLKSYSVDLGDDIGELICIALDL